MGATGAVPAAFVPGVVVAPASLGPGGVAAEPGTAAPAALPGAAGAGAGVAAGPASSTADDGGIATCVPASRAGEASIPSRTGTARRISAVAITTTATAMPRNPTVCAIVSMRGGILRPLAASTNRSRIRPPSNPGTGSSVRSASTTDAATRVRRSASVPEAIASADSCRTSAPAFVASGSSTSPRIIRFNSTTPSAATLTVCVKEWLSASAAPCAL